ncbi:hypothetical protein FH5_02015 [Priestia endophytica]|nr:hypothetical protein FH5_02015 [Priestia endophytica]
MYALYIKKETVFSELFLEESNPVNPLPVSFHYKHKTYSKYYL